MPTDEILTLEIEPPYIGSAVSPTVDIDETTDDITVTITDFRGEHSYTVEKTDQAIEDAEQAAQNANNTAQTVAQGWANRQNEINVTMNSMRTLMTNSANAESQRVIAENARVDAENAREQEWGEISTDATAAIDAANAAAGQATTAAQGATSATNAANDATTRANNTITGITQSANQIFAQAGQATTDANAAAQSANTAATNANNEAQSAARNMATIVQAFGEMTQYAEQVTDAAEAATQTANTAAEQADAAREAIQDDLAAKADVDGYYQQLTAGLADTLMSGDSEVIQFAQRTSDHDGMVNIQSIRGNTIVENDELVSVNIEGVKSVGFNQWDEEWEIGSLNTITGDDDANNTRIRSKNYISALPNTTYYVKSPNTISVRFYTANKSYLGESTVKIAQNSTFLTPASAYFMRFTMINTTTYNHDICINLSDPTRNGTYKPYRHSTRALPIAEYFTGGMKSAGTAADALYEDHADTVIGAVDLGTLTWTYASGSSTPIFSTSRSIIGGKQDSVNCSLPGYDAVAFFWNSSGNDMCVAFGSDNLNVSNGSYTDAAAFKAAMSGVMLYYELATPTTQPIDPPLNLTYPTEQGGTESLVLADGANSAPPTWEIVYAYDADGIIDKSHSAIAPVENSAASTNYAVGSYLVRGGTLYRVTSAIASGEAITPGTNCTATTVMAEIIRLTA